MRHPREAEVLRAQAQKRVERAMKQLQIALAAADGTGDVTAKQLRAPARTLRRVWDNLDVLRGELAELVAEASEAQAETGGVQ